MHKGFTLIELLAVIVILAVIALITVPIVLNMIEDAKENSALRAADFYLDAVEYAIIKQNMQSIKSFTPEKCIINNDGDAICDGVFLKIEVDGSKPTLGTIVFDSGKIVDVSLNIQDTQVVIDINNSLSTHKTAKICMAVTEDTKTTGNVPQGKFNIGDEYKCKVKNGTIYTFFILSVDDDKVNLILDRNINSDGTLATTRIIKTEQSNNIYNITPWISLEDYVEAGNLESSYSSNSNKKGPLTIVKFLNSATSEWTSIPNLNEKHEDSVYGSIELIGRARIPYLSEIIASEVGCELIADGIRETCPFWLSNYSKDNSFYNLPGRAIIDDINGYWLMDSKNGYNAYYVIAGSGVYSPISSSTNEKIGVRPVITISKNNM